MLSSGVSNFSSSRDFDDESVGFMLARIVLALWRRVLPLISRLVSKDHHFPRHVLPLFHLPHHLNQPIEQLDGGSTSLILKKPVKTLDPVAKGHSGSR